jgi:MFS family permease
MTTTTAKRTPIALVALLSFALLINYVDRGSIGIAAPLIQTEFHLSPSQMGWVLAAFFWAYAPMQPFMGWLADRIGAERVLVSGFCVWSIATVLTGVATGFAMLFARRTVSAPAVAQAGPTTIAVLGQRALWAGMLGSFCITYAFTFVLTWMPLYLVQERGMSLTTMTQVSGSTFIADGVGTVLSAYIVDKWISRGGSANVAYKTVLAVSSAGVAMSLFLCTVVVG